MNVLVAGGAGYIGSITAERLIESGHHVVVLDNLSKGHRAAVHPKALFVEGDLGDTVQISRLCAESAIDTVMHFAALTEVGESVAEPQRYFDNNFVRTKRLVDGMLEAGVSRFVFSSSAAVYGEPEQIPIPETHPKSPTNPYGWSKLFVEEMVRSYEKPYGLRSIIFRYFNAAGATLDLGEDHSPESHLIPIILEAAMGRRSAVRIFGTDWPTPDHTCIRDYIHVLDLADAHCRAVEKLAEGHPGGAYNLGNGEGYSVRQVIETACAVTGCDIRVEEAPRRPGDPARLVASSEKAREELDWTPQIPELDRIIRSAWDWMGTHLNGYNDR